MDRTVGCASFMSGLNNGGHVLGLVQQSRASKHTLYLLVSWTDFSKYFPKKVEGDKNTYANHWSL